MPYILENCQLEWDQGRGVLYIHDKDTGKTVVRICRLPPERGNELETMDLAADTIHCSITFK